MKKQALFLSAITLLIFATSCTEAFKKKMDTANKYLDEMMAKSVVCGTASETNNGVSMSMTTLKFEKCDAGLTDAERERRANNVAKEFYDAMTPEDLSGETHLKITAETEDDMVYEYLFDLNDLKELDTYKKITDQMFEACIAQDTATIVELKDNTLMPDDQMYQIYDVMAYNDSLYAGQNPVKDMLGYRLTNGVDDPNQLMYSANYLYTGTEFQTMYTINVDRKTKKVVYVWLKSDPK